MGFSLLEILIVVAVIGILSTLVVALVSGTSRHANEVASRQQQTELQTALGNWLVSKSSDPGGLAAARATYSSAPDKLSLLTNYLQPNTLAYLRSTGTNVTSAALDSANAYLRFSDWPLGGHQPTVDWVNK